MGRRRKRSSSSGKSEEEEEGNHGVASRRSSSGTNNDGNNDAPDDDGTNAMRRKSDRPSKSRRYSDHDQTNHDEEDHDQTNDNAEGEEEEEGPNMNNDAREQGDDDYKQDEEEMHEEEEEEEEYDARGGTPEKRASSSRSSRGKKKTGNAQIIPASPSASSRRSAAEVRESIASPLKHRNKNKAGKPAEAGVIKRVTAENFMCHRKLTVDLCRNVNFIHGQNGSGKSAVLAALQICLGAGARRTHRARNLRDLIRKGPEGGIPEGQRSAKVRVTLYNEGDDAFDHDTYGDEITVERVIASASGGFNGYRLLDEDGVERSRLKKDLDAMLDQLNIQVENPVAVLDQEEAKKFLMGKAEDKYSFFMKATELERLDRSYANIHDNLLQMEEDQNRIRKTLAGSEDRMKKLKKEWESYQELQGMNLRIDELSAQFAWATVKSQEENRDRTAEKKTLLEEKLEQARLSLAKLKEDIGDGSDRREEKERHIEALTKESETAADTKRDLGQQLILAKKPLKQYKAELKACQTEQKAAARSLKEAKGNLKEARDQIEQLAGSAESDAARRTKRLREAEEERDSLKSSLEEVKTNSSMYLKQYEELEPHVEQMKGNVQNAEGQMNSIHRRIQELQRSAQNAMAVFGDNCVKIHQKVEEAKRLGKFKGPVVGPIGHYIKVIPGKEHLAALAESTLGGKTMLDRFIVCNSADASLYREIREKVKASSKECNYFVMSPEKRFTICDPPTEGIDTVATVLNISNDLVFNCLVDNCQIDVTALATSKEDSEEKLLVTTRDANGNERESIRGKIKTVFFLPHGDQWKVTNGFRTMQSSNAKHGLKQTIGVDRTAAIAEANREFEQLKTEVSALREEEAQKKAQLHEVKKKWNAENKTLSTTKRSIDNLEREMETIKEEQATADNYDIDTSELEADVTTAEQRLEELKGLETQWRNKMEDVMPQIQALEKKDGEESARIEKIMNDIAKAEQEFETILKGEGEAKRKIKKREEKIEQRVAELEIAEKELSDIEESIESSIRAARRLTLVMKRNQEKEKREKEQGAAAESNDGTTATGQPSSQQSEDMTQTQYTEEELMAMEPVEIDRTPDEYQNEIVKLRKRAERERERRNLSEADGLALLEKFLRAKNELKAKLKSLDDIDQNQNLLVKDLKDRKQRWRSFRECIANLTNHTFDEILNQKGSSGEIEFDHRDKKLNLIVQKDNTNESSQTKDVKALSGGERSFTTLSLLLALGENLETPFRVMDEFDVFLDPVARRLALKTMVEIGKEMSHRQFIFITPQDLSSLPTDDKVRIILLRPPDRSGTQQTL